MRNAPPVDQWDTNRLNDLQIEADSDEINALTAVMRDYEFSCNGTIRQWKFQWHISNSNLHGACTITFTFYTLRPQQVNSDSCILTPVGRNSINVRPDGDSSEMMENVSNISVEERITVQAGDIVGVRVQLDRDCDDVRLHLAGRRSTSNTVYYETFDESEESALPNIFNNIDICRSSYDRDEVSPYITAVVGKEDIKNVKFLSL